VEIVWVALFAFLSVLAWASVKTLQIGLAWKLTEDLQKNQELVEDLNLEKILREWEKE
jgi:hypothetical protein